MMKFLLPLVGLLSFYTASGQSNKCPAKCKELKNTYQIKQIKEMHDEVNEASGLEIASGNNLWTHGDGGTGTTLFKLGPEGNLLEKIKLENLKNDDWEDLARDRKGNLYIGDFGNNKGKRKELQIFKVSEKDPKGDAKVIKYTYSDQKEIDPKVENPAYDTEAFFWSNGQLYLFNKNVDCQKYAKVYRLSDQPGKQTAQLIDSIRLNSQISSADISPDGKTVVLLGLEELYFLEMNSKNNFSNGTVNCLKLPGIGKSEGITFKNNTDLIVCNENGMMYRVSKNGTVSKKNNGKPKSKKS